MKKVYIIVYTMEYDQETTVTIPSVHLTKDAAEKALVELLIPIYDEMQEDNFFERFSVEYNGDPIAFLLNPELHDQAWEYGKLYHSVSADRLRFETFEKKIIAHIIEKEV
jgi:hypothetical protein